MAEGRAFVDNLASSCSKERQIPPSDRIGKHSLMSVQTTLRFTVSGARSWT